ncbi:hypothetical protein AVEN_44009-1 [Araneus ventricosus]|uniref:Uncharacterized protein n=1 Tax=Araneus ventricosus TaxID=182803 RepID=A0A4Y2N699_ARAVE|nr:hypothetical protein AVEN_44009-1 [Araneus ventricosus]
MKSAGVEEGWGHEPPMLNGLPTAATLADYRHLKGYVRLGYGGEQFHAGISFESLSVHKDIAVSCINCTQGRRDNYESDPVVIGNLFSFAVPQSESSRPEPFMEPLFNQRRMTTGTEAELGLSIHLNHQLALSHHHRRRRMAKSKK